MRLVSIGDLRNGDMTSMLFGTIEPCRVYATMATY